jgi:hypothetical protein
MCIVRHHEGLEHKSKSDCDYDYDYDIDANAIVNPLQGLGHLVVFISTIMLPLQGNIL